MKFEKNEEQNPWIHYRIGNCHRRIRFNEVQYFKAEDKSVKMVFDGGEAIIDNTLREIEKIYSEHVMRVHRNTLINKIRIDSIKRSSDGNLHVTIEGSNANLELSRRMAAQLKKQL